MLGDGMASDEEILNPSCVETRKEFAEVGGQMPRVHN